MGRPGPSPILVSARINDYFLQQPRSLQDDYRLNFSGSFDEFYCAPTLGDKGTRYKATNTTGNIDNMAVRQLESRLAGTHIADEDNRERGEKKVCLFLTPVGAVKRDGKVKRAKRAKAMRRGLQAHFRANNANLIFLRSTPLRRVPRPPPLLTAPPPTPVTLS